MGTVSFTRPIDQQVNNHQGLETALAKAFKQVFADVFEQQVQDMLDYGCPHLGSRTVIERFSKQDGLVVLRRPLTSDTLMRVIYANWSSLASERGLGFLEFVLRMIWTDQWQIKRLWHPIKTYLNYPKHITDEEKPDHFLTSRLRISIEDTVDTSEIIELSPILRRLVPANVVLKVHSKALDVELGDSAIGVGVYGKVYQVIDFSDHAAEPEIEHEWSDWILNPAVTINTNGITHYTAYKTNQREYYDSYADLDLTTAIVRSLHDENMQQWQAVTDAINTITGGVGIWEFMSDHVLWFNPTAWNDPSNQYYWTVDGKATLSQAGSNLCYVTGQAACNKYATDNSWQSTWVQNNSCYGYDSSGRYSSAEGLLQNCTIKLSNPDCAIFGGSEVNGVFDSFTNVKTCYGNSNHTDNLGGMDRVVNPNYVIGTEPPTTIISFNTIAQKIILNASSSNQGIALFSEAYIEAVANSIFNADESKQFVKIADLVVLFELNKYLRL